MQTLRDAEPSPVAAPRPPLLSHQAEGARGHYLGLPGHTVREQRRHLLLIQSPQLHPSYMRQATRRIRRLTWTAARNMPGSRGARRSAHGKRPSRSHRDRIPTCENPHVRSRWHVSWVVVPTSLPAGWSELHVAESPCAFRSLQGSAIGWEPCCTSLPHPGTSSRTAARDLILTCRYGTPMRRVHQAALICCNALQLLLLYMVYPVIEIGRAHV